MTETSLIAWLTTSGNTVGADAGITVSESVMEDGILRKHHDLALENTSLTLEDDDGWIDVDAADAMLAGMGFLRLDQWNESGGQWAAKVVRATDA